MARERCSAGGVVLHGGRVLVLYKRTNGEWRLPKGSLDGGEEPVAGALREVREETGFADLEIVADLGDAAVRFSTLEGPVERHERYFAMRLASFARAPRGRRDGFRFQVFWLPVPEALARLTFESERAAVERAVAQAGRPDAPLPRSRG